MCGNHELLSDGRVDDQYQYNEEINSAIGKACRFLEERDGVDNVEVDSSFHKWRGGDYRTAGLKIGGNKFGYSCGFVATFKRNPSEQLMRGIDEAHFILVEELDSIGLQEDKDNSELSRERKEEGESWLDPN